MWRMVSQLATSCGAGLCWFTLVHYFEGLLVWPGVVGQQHKCEQDLDNRAQLSFYK
jgi:hypothetical protein